MTKLAFIDLETTGTDPARHSLWEIGLILVSEETEQRYCWQVMPDLSVADPMALRVGRFYVRFRLLGSPVGKVRAMIHPSDVAVPEMDAASLAAYLAPVLDGASLIAANVAFDAAFLAAFLRANGQCPTWDYHLVEIESYAAGALGLEPPWKLNALLDDFGVSVSREYRHTALGDAQAIRELWHQVGVHNRAAKMLAAGCEVAA